MRHVTRGLGQWDRTIADVAAEIPAELYIQGAQAAGDVQPWMYQVAGTGVSALAPFLPAGYQQQLEQAGNAIFASGVALEQTQKAQQLVTTGAPILFWVVIGAIIWKVLM